MFASDMEQSDRSNLTTDDEFYNELMSVPPESEDCLIPEHCKNELEALEHLTKCLNDRYSAYPFVFMGTLKDALREAFSQKNIADRRPILIYVNNDKSVSTNLFCKQLLCHEKTIDYLMNNYVLWAWDVTFESNAQKLDEIFKSIFRSWSIEKGFNTDALDQYPLVIGVTRDRTGEYLVDRLIEGPKNKPNLEEFLRSLTEFKAKFAGNEQELETAKEEAKQQMLLNLTHASDLYHRSKHYKDRAFLRSISTFPHRDLEKNFEPNNQQFGRLFSVHPGARDQPHGHPMNFEDSLRAFKRGSFDEEDSDDADDEDDERTPTVERPQPNFT